MKIKIFKILSLLKHTRSYIICFSFKIFKINFVKVNWFILFGSSKCVLLNFKILFFKKFLKFYFVILSSV
jgi:hypothetical protein